MIELKAKVRIVKKYEVNDYFLMSLFFVLVYRHLHQVAPDILEVRTAPISQVVGALVTPHQAFLHPLLLHFLEHQLQEFPLQEYIIIILSHPVNNLCPLPLHPLQYWRMKGKL